VAHSRGDCRSARSAAVVFPAALAPVEPVLAKEDVGTDRSAPITTSERIGLATFI
jgi:hypothetical protein